MILENFGKFGRLSILKKIIKICHKQNVKCLVFFKAIRQVCNHLYMILIKTALKPITFFKKLFLHF